MTLYCYKPTYTCAEPLIMRTKPIYGVTPYMIIKCDGAEIATTRIKVNATDQHTTADCNTPGKHVKQRAYDRNGQTDTKRTCNNGD